jgi:hypothetical protein
MDFKVPKDLPKGKLIERVSGWYVQGMALDPTGLDFADWFCHHTIEDAKLPDGFKYYVHSANQRGAMMIRDRMFRATRQECSGWFEWYLKKGEV